MHLERILLVSVGITFTAIVNAHVKLEDPVPYGAATLDTNPLLASGSDWPCKQRQGWDIVTKVNIVPIGQPQTISFIGQATHGGGSCQIALTTDTPPNKNSQFKVIKSIQGGCPSTFPGNVGDSPFGKGADKFNYTIPSSIPAGKNYTLAWTWFNKIGDREMYMNCAPISVPANGSPGSKLNNKQANGMASLPNLFRANIGNGCKSAESGTVLAIPHGNLGKNVERIGSEPLVPPLGNCGDLAPPSAPASVPNVAEPFSPSVSSAKAQPTTHGPLPVNSHTSSSATPSTVEPAATSQASAQATAGVGSSSSPTSFLQTGTCNAPGKSVCSPDGKAWGTCDDKNKVIYQPVAVGTKCDPTLGVEVAPSRKHRRWTA